MLHDVQRRPRSLIDRFFKYLDRRSPGDRLFFTLAGLLFIGSIIYLLISLNNSYSIATPARGGTYIEGIIGTPRFINPVLAITRADHDLTALVYSGLLKLNGAGELEPDLAESINISDDGQVYHVVLKDNILFHDLTPLTTADVAFTISLIQNPELKSPLRGNWSGITVEVIDEHELNFVLEEPYVPFVENFTLGIIPKHIWSSLSTEELPFSQYNAEPIGTGPYSITNVGRNNAGLIDTYNLKAFEGGQRQPHIETIVLKFYPNETALSEAYAKREIMGSASLPSELIKSIEKDKTERLTQTLPRVFGVFINQNRNIALRDVTVREALSAAVDRDALISAVLDGYGQPTTAPLPPNFYQDTSTTSSQDQSGDSTSTAKNLLEEAGWTHAETNGWTKKIDGATTTLAVSIATANTYVFATTAEYLKQAWEALGIPVTIGLFEQTDLVQAVIRPRNYEVLLFGTDIGRSLDLYPFWHSSQRDDPGYNVALYTNITTDDLLEAIRTTQDEAEREEMINQAVKAIASEIPAIFLFSPSFVYVVDEKVKVTPVARLGSPSERFSTIDQWYIEETSMWPIFNTD